MDERTKGVSWRGLGGGEGVRLNRRTWKDRWEASMATEMGPTVATAVSRADSLFDLMST